MAKETKGRNSARWVKVFGAVSSIAGTLMLVSGNPIGAGFLIGGLFVFIVGRFME